ncbi:hypothetical protein EJ06DRAFT_195178 [Trichodelitschia bisporula]|uniref:Uncharacterized protein n=1 Tax=Trichodelitschia bisporula TaxID=703511 RepID=A0A6G1I8H2_9PEZI|nr:hypothetical protein EJ06DRAFT_195178 [Trichodelitschia bisporula]
MEKSLQNYNNNNNNNSLITPRLVLAGRMVGSHHFRSGFDQFLWFYTAKTLPGRVEEKPWKSSFGEGYVSPTPFTCVYRLFFAPLLCVPSENLAARRETEKHFISQLNPKNAERLQQRRSRDSRSCDRKREGEEGN